MNFPLWKLPHVPRALVIRQVEPINVIQLSMKSKRLKSFLMIFKLFAYKLSLSFGEEQYPPRYDYKPPDLIRLSIMFDKDDDWNYFERKSEWHFEFFAQNDAEKQFQKLKTQNLCILYDLGSQALRIQRIQALTNHILDIVYVKKYELGHFIIPGYNSWNNFFLKDQIKNFEKVDIDTRKFETWSAGALQDLFNNLRTKELWLRIRIDTPGTHRFKFNKLTHFYLFECDWLSVDDLIEVDSEWYHLSLNEPMDLMKIVVAWKSGKKMENLFELIMDFQGKVSPDDVLQKIDQFEGVRKYQDEDNARFFKRDTDGQIAFICVGEQYFELSLNKIGCEPYQSPSI
ncbi:unnamed protein product [Caenorhabditis brenneri]